MVGLEGQVDRMHVGETLRTQVAHGARRRWGGDGGGVELLLWDCWDCSSREFVVIFTAVIERSRPKRRIDRTASVWKTSLRLPPAGIAASSARHGGANLGHSLRYFRVQARIPTRRAAQTPRACGGRGSQHADLQVEAPVPVLDWVLQPRDVRVRK